MKQKVEPVLFAPNPKPVDPFLVERRAWLAARGRCLNPTHRDWKNYGGRGITFYEPWINDFDAFLEHVGPKPSPELSLDRIDNSLGYQPGNVRWATHVQQGRNSRRLYPSTSGGQVLAMRDEVDRNLLRVNSRGQVDLSGIAEHDFYFASVGEGGQIIFDPVRIVPKEVIDS